MRRQYRKYCSIITVLENWATLKISFEYVTYVKELTGKGMHKVLATIVSLFQDNRATVIQSESEIFRAANKPVYL